MPEASSSARLLESPLGSYLESLAQTLQGQSYSREVIRNYVHAARRFGEWLSKQGLPLCAVSDQLISRYIDQFHKRITLLTPMASDRSLPTDWVTCLLYCGKRASLSQQNRSHRPRNNGWLGMTNT